MATHRKSRRPSSWHFTRDTALFVTGLAGIIFEILRHGAERPTLLLLLGTMVGLPSFLRADEKRRGKQNDDEEAAP